MRDRAIRIILILLGVLLIAGIILFASGRIGNPVSDLLGQKTVLRVLSEKYPDGQFLVLHSGYVPGEGRYVYSVGSEKFADECFDVFTDAGGQYLSDTRDSRVTSGWNTAMRLSQQYQDEANLIFDHVSYRITSASATLAIDGLGFDAPCMKMSELIPNRAYDMGSLGEDYGHIRIDMEDDTVTPERMGEILLELKKVFEIAEISFSDIGIRLRFSGTEQQSGIRIELELSDFPCDEIYEENITERIRSRINTEKKE